MKGEKISFQNLEGYEKFQSHWYRMKEKKSLQVIANGEFRSNDVILVSDVNYQKKVQLIKLT